MDEDSNRRKQAENSLDEWLCTQDEGEVKDKDKEAFLRSNEDIRDILEEMLDEMALADGLLGAVDLRESESSETPGQPRTLGDFEIFGELGRGGMGVVYKARQISLNRIVALKVLPQALSLSKESIARFRREASTVARLRHAGIVPVHAIGEEDGAHFFAMELVEGISLDKLVSSLVGRKPEELTTEVLTEALKASALGESEWVDDEAHGWIRLAVEWVRQVAEALHFAHEAGVLHRDVKPGNILLRADGHAMLTDFGLSQNSESPSATRTGEFRGTPYYVSPEQAMSGRAQMDRRSDVYSLGVTLFELLTLHRPFEGNTALEVFGRIIHKAPPSPHRFNPDLPPDLVNITLKAMDRDPDRRYATARDIADDLQAFLEYRPVSARRVPFWVASLRWARREPLRATLLVGGATALVVITFLYANILEKSRELKAKTVSLAEQTQALEGSNTELKLERSRLAKANEDLGTRTRDAEIARDEARSALGRLQRVVQFHRDQITRTDLTAMGVSLVGHLRLGIEETLATRDMTQEEQGRITGNFEELRTLLNPTDLARTLMNEQVLAKAVEVLDGEWSEDPIVESALRDAISISYVHLGMPTLALPQIQRAVELRHELLGVDHDDSVTSTRHLARTLVHLGQYAEAAEALRGTLARLTEETPPRSILIVDLCITLSEALSMERDIPGSRAALALASEYLGAGGPRDGVRRVTIQLTLAGLELRSGNLDQTEAILRDVLEPEEGPRPQDSEETMYARNTLGVLLANQGKIDEAEKCFRDLLKVQERVLGVDHPNTLDLLTNLGFLLMKRGKLQEGERILRDTSERSVRVHGSRHPDTLSTKRSLGRVLRKLNRLEESEQLLSQVLDLVRQTQVSQHWSLGVYVGELGHARLALGRWQESVELLEESHATLSAALGESHERTRAVGALLGEAYTQWNKAEPNPERAEKAAEWSQIRD